MLWIVRNVGSLCLMSSLWVGLTSLQPAEAAERYALVIGVNDYLRIGPNLNGPSNDADAVVAYLKSASGPGFRPDHITVLANGTYKDPDGEPDRATIMASMRQLAQKAKDGDFVYLHFGGHGSQQKATSDIVEPDGRDEVFLPSDTGMPKDGVYPNALVDDEIGQLIGGIRATGAFVFVVFDSCQSSSATRTADGVGQDRQRWLPEPVGLPASSMVEGKPQEPWLDTGDLGAQDGRGGMVEFFAAQTVEPTPEMLLPFGNTEARTHGLFSYAILEALTRNPGITYRQLAESVMHFYAVWSVSQPTPLFQGDLDRKVFGDEEAAQIMQWPVGVDGPTVRVPAGKLHGLKVGDILAIVPEPTSPAENATGYVRLISAEALESQATPVEYRNSPLLEPVNIPAGSLARPVEFPVPLELSVTVQPSSKQAFEAANAVARKAVASIAGDEALPLNLKVETGNVSAAGLKLLVASEADLYPAAGASDLPRLWFLPADGQLPVDSRMKPHSIGLDGGLDEGRGKQLALNLAAMFRTSSLSRLASIPHAGKAPDVSFFVDGGKSELQPITTPNLPVGSIIEIKVENGSSNPLDVDVLLIGPDYSIQHMMGERFQPRASLETPIIRVGGNLFGTRRVVVIAREVFSNTPQADLSFLEQIGVRTRGSEADSPRSVEILVAGLASDPPSTARVRYDPTSDLKSSIASYSFAVLPQP